MLIAPIQHIERLELADANRALEAWAHKMGPCRRPMGTQEAHGMFWNGRMVALTITADLPRETCAGLTRAQAIELARLCAERRDLCRPMLRLWREFIFPAFERPWAVSYQDERLHSGDTYRFDGWVRIATKQRSGTDQRTNRIGRVKTVWAWHSDPGQRKARRALAHEAGDE
jgi:hypothetical protein